MKPNKNNFINMRCCNINQWCTNCVPQQPNPAVTVYYCCEHETHLEIHKETNSIIAVDNCDKFNGIDLLEEKQAELTEKEKARLNIHLLKRDTAGLLTDIDYGLTGTCLRAIEDLGTGSEAATPDEIIKAINDLRGELSSIMYRVDQYKRNKENGF